MRLSAAALMLETIASALVETSDSAKLPARPTMQKRDLGYFLTLIGSKAAFLDRAGCARSTVAIAIKALEQVGILSWVRHPELG
jgi:F420-dependent methylenetetrahydromethanopterin dehydrogenase